MMKLSLGCEVIDKITGGLSTGLVTLVYGPPSSGKTTLALQSCASAMRGGLRFLYINCYGKLHPQRVAELLRPYPKDEIKECSLVLDVHDLPSLQRTLLILEDSLGGDLRLIVVDTITRAYRGFLGDRRYNVKLNKLLNRIMALMSSMAERYDVAFLLTSDSRIVQETEEPVSAKVLYFWSDVVLKLEHYGVPGRRLLIVEKHYKEELVGGSLECIITKYGMRGVL